MSKVYYQARADVMREYPDIVKFVRKEKRFVFKLYYGSPEEKAKITDEESTAILFESGRLYSNPDTQGPYLVAEKIVRSDIKRKSTLKKRIRELLLCGHCVFVTLTFTDDCLASTSPETRRRYVARFCKAHSSGYVGNIDFGGKNNREHYHAVILTDKAENKSRQNALQFLLSRDLQAC